eukprot:PhF_6_TR31700/c1_g1_i1/m.46644/K10863/APTX; aprataxin
MDTIWTWTNESGATCTFTPSANNQIETLYKKDDNATVEVEGGLICDFRRLRLTIRGQGKTSFPLHRSQKKRAREEEPSPPPPPPQPAKEKSGRAPKSQAEEEATAPPPPPPVPAKEKSGRAPKSQAEEEATAPPPPPPVPAKEKSGRAPKSQAQEETTLAPPIATMPVSVSGSSKPIVALAFPSISTNIFMFDVTKAAICGCDAVSRFFQRYSGPAYAHIRLMLVDILPKGGKTLDDSEALSAFSKRWKAVNTTGETRFIIKLANITDKESRGDCVAIANAGNAKFSGNITTGGVNRAIHVAAGPGLEKDTKLAHPGGGTPGHAYPVAVRGASPLYAQGIRHIIHVIGPNMNPDRPNCLKGDYDTGCKLLSQCYDELFETFRKLHCSN